MKLTAILLVTASLQTMASATAQTVTISLKNVSLEEVFKEIRKQTDYDFIYNDAWLKKAKKVSIVVNKETVIKVLDICFRDQPFSYTIIQNTIALKLIDPPQKKDEAFQLLPPIDVRGKVVNEKGEPVSGATVTVKGTANATATNEKGDFLLRGVAENAILVFSGINVETYEVSVDARTDLASVSLKTKFSTTEEVIVEVNTGYQTISKERSAGSFSQVSGNVLRDKSFGRNNLIEGLEGLVPGLSVNAGGGQDPFLIRGIASLNSNRAPLYVVDGVAISFNEIDMINYNDVESVTFLKDATAASIWGSRAANGVIVITTRKRKGAAQKLRIFFDAYTSFRGKPDYAYQKFLDSRTFVREIQGVFSPADFPFATVTSPIPGVEPVLYPHEVPLYRFSQGLITAAQRDQELEVLASKSNRKQIERLFLQNAVTVNNSISFSEQSGIHRFYGSLSHNLSRSSDKSNENNYLVNLRQDLALAKWINVDLGLNASVTDQQGQVMPMLPTALNTYLPYEMFMDDAGNPLSQAHLFRYEPYRLGLEAAGKVNLNYFPAQEIDNAESKQRSQRLRMNMGITVKLPKGLSYEGRFQYLTGSSNGHLYYNKNSYTVRDELIRFTQGPSGSSTQPKYYLPTYGGHYTTNSGAFHDWTVRNQLSYDKNILNKHRVSLLAGTELRGTKNNFVSSLRRGFDPQTLTYELYDELFLAQTGVTGALVSPALGGVSKLNTLPFQVSETELRFFSLYSNGAYTYNNRYTFNGSIRVDQSNLFGTDPSIRYKPIWSAGLAWNADQEGFFRQLYFLDKLKLRLTYGLGGNAPDPGVGGPFDIIRSLNSATYAGLGLQYAINSPANNLITWEKTATTNFGIDFTIAKSRLSGSIDLYSKKTSNLIGSILLDPTSGWTRATANVGSMRNDGIELYLNAAAVQTRTFNWNTIFSFAYNKNKVVDYKQTPAPSNKVVFENMEGYPANALFAFQWAGLDSLGDPRVYDEKGNLFKKVSDIKSIDAIPYYGTLQPPFTGAITNTFSYKGFDFSFMFIGNFGHHLRANEYNHFSGRITTNVHQDFANRWKKPGDEKTTDIPSFLPQASLNTGRRATGLFSYGSHLIENASFIKLRDVSLSYNLPQSFIKKLSLESMRLKVQSNNQLMFLWNDKDIDPEAYNLRSGGRLERFGPSYTVALNIQFK